MASSLPKLQYFDIEAAAEKVRLAFAVCGVAFDDERVQFKDWGALKPSTPYGQLPVLTMGGMTVSQSGAMCRYICSKHDPSGTLYPTSDALKLLQVEEMIGLFEDFSRAWSPCIYLAMRPSNYGYPEDWDPAAKAAKVKEMREKFVNEQMGVFMAHFTKQIQKTGGAYLCGANVTLADLFMLPQLRYFEKGVADHVPKDILDKYPEIKAYMGRLYAHPKIKEWYKL